MLNDPLVINHGQTFTPTGGVASNFRRTAIGRYVSVDGSFTSATPARISFLPNVVLQGPSTYKARLEFEKAVSPVNGVQQKNDVCRVDINISGNLRSFTAADIIHAMYSLSIVIGQNFSRMISGET